MTSSWSIHPLLYHKLFFCKATPDAVKYTHRFSCFALLWLYHHCMRVQVIHLPISFRLTLTQYRDSVWSPNASDATLKTLWIKNYLTVQTSRLWFNLNPTVHQSIFSYGSLYMHFHVSTTTWNNKRMSAPVGHENHYFLPMSDLPLLWWWHNLNDLLLITPQAII